jgi:hypothetical protein
MQGKRRAARLFPQAIIDPDLFPAFQPFRLTLWQACTHWEIGFRQVQGVFLFRCVGAHIWRPLVIYGEIFRMARRGIPYALYRRLDCLERRACNSNNDRHYTSHERVIGLRVRGVKRQKPLKTLKGGPRPRVGVKPPPMGAVGGCPADRRALP